MLNKNQIYIYIYREKKVKIITCNIFNTHALDFDVLFIVRDKFILILP